MAVSPVVMYRGLLASSSTVVYTVPTGRTAIITNIWANNNNASALTFQVRIANVHLMNQTSIPGSGVISFDLRQPLAAGETIIAYASTASSVALHIAGVEVY